MTTSSGAPASVSNPYLSLSSAQPAQSTASSNAAAVADFFRTQSAASSSAQVSTTSDSVSAEVSEQPPLLSVIRRPSDNDVQSLARAAAAAAAAPAATSNPEAGGSGGGGADSVDQPRETERTTLIGSPDDDVTSDDEVDDGRSSIATTWREYKITIILGVASLASIGLGVAGLTTHSALTPMAKGFILGGLAIPLLVGMVHFINSKHSTRTKVVVFALALIVSLGLGLGSLSHAFAPSNQVMLESLKQWQGWIGAAGVLAITSATLLALRKKKA